MRPSISIFISEKFALNSTNSIPGHYSDARPDHYNESEIQNCIATLDQERPINVVLDNSQQSAYNSGTNATPFYVQLFLKDGSVLNPDDSKCGFLYQSISFSDNQTQISGTMNVNDPYAIVSETDIQNNYTPTFGTKLSHQKKGQGYYLFTQIADGRNITLTANLPTGQNAAAENLNVQTHNVDLSSYFGTGNDYNYIADKYGDTSGSYGQRYIVLKDGENTYKPFTLKNAEGGILAPTLINTDNPDLSGEYFTQPYELDLFACDANDLIYSNKKVIGCKVNHIGYFSQATGAYQSTTAILLRDSASIQDRVDNGEPNTVLPYYGIAFDGNGFYGNFNASQDDASLKRFSIDHTNYAINRVYELSNYNDDQLTFNGLDYYLDKKALSTSGAIAMDFNTSDSMPKDFTNNGFVSNFYIQGPATTVAPISVRVPVSFLDNNRAGILAYIPSVKYTSDTYGAGTFYFSYTMPNGIMNMHDKIPVLSAYGKDGGSNLMAFLNPEMLNKVDMCGDTNHVTSSLPIPEKAGINDLIYVAETGLALQVSMFRNAFPGYNFNYRSYDQAKGSGLMLSRGGTGGILTPDVISL
ncbi:hypothetical protein [Cysteiniphilum litorale]|uniref:Uncharacterized protein n=2 Tax=Cysteiniphilum TaxID=2056696 RepID=A0A8J3EA92_9GAMM|nr:hypothetical protein [Cysteiniphilum litorale]GGG08630.1 hypothetical protein GCM10010995_27720 [Cysteiniphilum litorale]